MSGPEAKATGIGIEVDVGDDVEDEVESSDRGPIEVGVDVVAGIDIPDGMLIPDAMERLEQVEEGLQDIYEHVIEIPLQRIEDIETRQRELEARSLIAARADRFQRCVSFMESELRQIRRFRYYDRMRFRRLETFAARRLVAISRIESHRVLCLVLWNMTITRSGMTPEVIEELVNRRVEEALAAYEATRTANALEAESQSQNGSDGDNRNGGDGNGGDGNGGNENPNENNRGVRLNSHKRTIGIEAAFAMSWRKLMKLMAEISRVDYDVHQDGPEEEDRVEKFIGGLPDNIQGNVIAVEPTRIQDAVRIANNLMDQKLKGYEVKNTENKRMLEVNLRDNSGQQPPFKRQYVRGQNVARAYTTGNNEKRGYAGPLPYCSKCKLHHKGPCTMKCGKCNKVRHMARDCKNAVAVPTTQRA
ncbi:hypothetical protein Tco_1419037, partial [Tanacetum coccineum]